MYSKKIILLIWLSVITLSCKQHSQNNQNNHTNLVHKKDSLSKDTITQHRTNRMHQLKHRIDSTNKSLEWKKLSSGLWSSNRGDIGFKTREGTAEGIFIDKYIIQVCCEGESMRTVVDTLTFKYLGSSFYKDKNHIYTHYDMADGGNFWIVEDADVATFKVIGDCYARDKHHIFGERAMVMDSVDYKTFKTKKGIGCFAKDKNGYYFWDSKIEVTEITDSEVKKVLTVLQPL